MQLNKLLQIAFMIITTSAFSQYKVELGISGGGMSYLGDANPKIPFANPNTSLGGFFRFNINSRFAIKTGVNYGTVQGNNNARILDFPVPQNREFSQQIIDIAATLEYNFFPYTNENIKFASLFSPYLFVGGGGALINRGFATGIATLPFGVGAKFRLFDRLNSAVEIGIRKLFVDYLDYDGTNYFNNPLGLPNSLYLNNDYYMNFGLTVSFNFMKPQWDCNDSEIYSF